MTNSGNGNGNGSGNGSGIKLTDQNTDAIRMSVAWRRLISIVEEQAQALIRTAFSTSVREAGDLSAGVYDRQGRMLAQAVTGTPGHVNAMADAVPHFIAEIGIENMADGDVYLTNDPWKGTGHLHDITVVTPVFRAAGLTGFFACTAHIVDIGGRGFGADGRSLYEEGLQLPIMRFASRGEVMKDLIRIIRQNVREPDQVVGDIYALASCNEIGQRRLMDAMDEFGLQDLDAVASFILERSHIATLERINALLPRFGKQNGYAEAKNSMVIDGMDEPITLACTLRIEQDRVSVNFTGTSAAQPWGINVPLVYTKAYTCYGLKVALAPDIPNNSASLAPFVISAPAGSIVNAERPAAVALRHVVGQMLPDVVFGALDKLLPGLVQAEGASALCNFQLSLYRSDDATERAEVLSFNSGGSGARPKLDGLNTTAFPSGVMTMPVEATEAAGPVMILRKELRPDSGGPGRYRGGLGQYMDIAARPGWQFDFSAMFDRLNHPARGRQGGMPGGATRITLDDGTELAGKGRQAIPQGRIVRLALAGGGGYGKPEDRDPDAIIRDLELGYISAHQAEQFYGFAADKSDRQKDNSQPVRCRKDEK